MLEFPVNFCAKLALEFTVEFLPKTNARIPSEFLFVISRILICDIKKSNLWYHKFDFVILQIIICEITNYKNLDHFMLRKLIHLLHLTKYDISRLGIAFFSITQGFLIQISNQNFAIFYDKLSPVLYEETDMIER